MKEIHSRFGLETLLADIGDFDSSSIARIPSSKLAIFVVSTYGEGDPPDNAHELWNWISNNKNENLSNLRYAAFGLGNSNYKSYNKVIDVIADAFTTFGAHSLLPVGRADDARGSTMEDFFEWQDQLFKVFKNELHYVEREIGYEPSTSVVISDNLDSSATDTVTAFHAHRDRTFLQQNSEIYSLPVASSKLLFDERLRQIVHIDLDRSKFPELKYRTGDHVAVWPQNPDMEVEMLLTALGLQAQKGFRLNASAIESDAKLKIPAETTVLNLFKHHLDICGPVSRDFMPILASFAPTEAVKTLLIQLGSDREAFSTYLSSRYTNVARLLSTLAPGTGSWSQLPLSCLVDYVPAQKPRFYSISSSSVVQPQTIAITAVVQNSSIASDLPAEQCLVPGLAGNYMLRSMKGPANLAVHVRKSNFKLPMTSATPIVMVATGTGIAPFRAFLHERARLATMGRTVGKTILFYGCRTSADMLYTDELADISTTLGDAFEIVHAFSREEKVMVEGRELKAYVQHRVNSRFEEVRQMLMDDNACLYICGSAGMGRDVVEALASKFEATIGWSREAFGEWSKQQKKKRKWFEDVWG